MIPLLDAGVRKSNGGRGKRHAAKSSWRYPLVTLGLAPPLAWGGLKGKAWGPKYLMLQSWLGFGGIPANQTNHNVQDL